MEFLSDEWIEMARTHYEEIERVPDELKNVDSVVTVVVNGVPPDGRQEKFYVIVDSGLMVDLGRGDPPVKPDAIVEGDYETAKGLITGATKAEKAITSGKVKVEGDIGRLVGFAQQQQNPDVQAVTAKIREKTD